MGALGSLGASGGAGSLGALGSYVGVRPGFYKTYYPDTQLHAGSSGFKTAPVPGWGENHLLAGPARISLGTIDWENAVLPAVISSVAAALITQFLLNRRR